MSPSESGGPDVAVAGWYADPADAARVRWWDGAAWTEHVQDVVVEPAPTGITLEPAYPAEPAVLPLDAVGATPVAVMTGHEQIHQPAAQVAAHEQDVASADPAPLAAFAAADAAASASALDASLAATAAPTAVAVLDRPGGFDPEPGVILPPVRESTLTTTTPAALRPGAFASSGPPSVIGVAGGSGRRVPWVWLIVTALVLGALGAGVGFVGLPWWQARQATEAAAALPPSLAQEAPRFLARQRLSTAPGTDPAAAAGALVARGSAWAWAATYGPESNRAYYLAAELAEADWARATLALEDPEIARAVVAEVGAGLVAGAGGEATVGVAREYATLGAGRTWCREVWVAGRAGGHCLWTNGREILQAIHLPSVEALAAKKTLVALQQLQASTP